MALLELDNLTMHYQVPRGAVRAVEGVSLAVEPGRALGLAGESGCGKSSMALTILRLLPSNGRIVSGEMRFRGQDILRMDEEQFRRDVRWKKMSMIFQGAMNALNPVLRVGAQIAEAIVTHEQVSTKEAEARARQLLDMVGINPRRYNEYPHEFSGGMKQRVVIAMALACNPDLIIADEPTTALDVMVQAQVLRAIQDLRSELQLSMLLISHDLSVIAQTCDDVAIMYAGRIVEYGSAEAVYRDPRHPYTRALLQSFPNIAAEERAEIRSIPGTPPNLLDPPPGCRFHPRCPLADRYCQKVEPSLERYSSEQLVACHKAG